MWSTHENDLDSALNISNLIKIVNFGQIKYVKIGQSCKFGLVNSVKSGMAWFRVKCFELNTMYGIPTTVGDQGKNNFFI